MNLLSWEKITQTFTPNPKQTLTLKMVDDAKMIGNVEVTAQKRHTTQLQQTATIGSDALEKGGATSLAKLLETVLGVSSISTGNLPPNYRTCFRWAAN